MVGVGAGVPFCPQPVDNRKQNTKAKPMKNNPLNFI
jgi:hypothetical protein